MTKKMVIIIVVVLFVITAITFSFAEGMLQKRDIYLGNNISMSSNIGMYLKDAWEKTEDKEYSVCLRSDDSKIINGVDSMTLGDKFSVNPGHTCGNVAMLHKHPTSGCNTDLDTADYHSALADFSVGAKLYLIQCDVNILQIYTQTNLKGFVVKI